MKKILVTNGRKNAYAIVDDADFLVLRKRKWFLDKAGYACTALTKEEFGVRTCRRMHFFLHIPASGCVTDHKNCIKLDNRRENLRNATRQQNSANRPVYRNNRIGIKGVGFNRGKFQSRIRVNGELILIGRYDDPVEAGVAYENAAKKYFGDFARA